MIAVTIAVILGVLAGLYVPYNLSSETLPYVAVGLLAVMDTVFGGIWSYFERRFNLTMFVSGLVSNSILAILFVLMGNKLGLDLSLAVVVVFGVRIFNNLSSIRHFLFKRYSRKERIRARLLEASTQNQKNDE
ncbi:MAG: DUF1290 domain-containing protein [Ruminococcaceae bacterium]|nr:DUF1290 domain-containing protein [Oscillospiraceae bacterium]